MEDIEIVYIGNKNISKYINAGKWVLEKNKPLKLLGRGNNIKATVDVAEILKRSLEEPIVILCISSEEYRESINGEEKTRNVSILSVTLNGKLKE